MSSVSCGLTRGDGVDESKELNVGDVFYYVCKGEWPKLNPETIELRIDKEFQYKLKLLAFEVKSSDEARLTVTSYEVGQHKLPAVQLIDAENSVVLGDLEFTIKSVQDPQNPAKEPLGPVDPLSLSLAKIYWVSLLLIVLLVAGYFAGRVYQARQKKRLLKKMNVEQYSQTPINQYYASTRKLQRSSGIADGIESTLDKKQGFILELEQTVQIYFARKFLVPTLYWRPGKVVRDIKRNHPDMYDSIRKDFRKLYAEFDRAKKGTSSKSKKEISNRDCIQLMEMSRKLIEFIEVLGKNADKDVRTR